LASNGSSSVSASPRPSPTVPASVTLAKVIPTSWMWSGRGAAAQPTGSTSGHVATWVTRAGDAVKPSVNAKSPRANPWSSTDLPTGRLGLLHAGQDAAARRGAIQESSVTVLATMRIALWGVRIGPPTCPPETASPSSGPACRRYPGKASRRACPSDRRRARRAGPAPSSGSASPPATPTSQCSPCARR